MKNILRSFFILFAIAGNPSLAAIEETELFNHFIATMTSQHQFDEAEVRQLFKAVKVRENIIKAIKKPAEGMPWYKYRKIFLTDSRINQGIAFWQDNKAALTKVEREYGVPIATIVAIIGVETNYGKRTGNHRVIDALATLGFNYPKRSKFFLKELENFLLLCRDENINPLQPTGSYAGAMGIPQFMPSSFRAYAADFEQDGKTDIWKNPADAIASVANYFAKHNWRKDQPVAFPVMANGESFRQALNKDLKPDQKWTQLESLSISSEHTIDADERVKLLIYEQENGHSLWVGLHNFYVITRYNHSTLYAMAVYQLSQEIVENKLKSNKKSGKSSRKKFHK